MDDAALLEIVDQLNVWTAALLYFNDTANVISCTEMEPDLGPDDE